MDTEVQPIPHENGSKIEETFPDPPDNTVKNGEDLKAVTAEENIKTPPKSSKRETRSRSRTPQKKKDKIFEDNLKINLIPIEENVEKTVTRGPEKKIPKDSKEKVEETESGSASNDQEEKKIIRTSERRIIREAINKSLEEAEINTSVSGKDVKKNTRSSDKKNTEENRETEDTPNSSTNGIHKDEVAEKTVYKNDKELRKSPRKPHKSADIVEKLELESDTVEPESLAKKSENSKQESDGVEMDPLILVGDEPDPELQFDENSDMDSGKGSPILARCRTRRSFTRNIPTPKSPKSTTDSESSVAPTPTPDLNETNDSASLDNASTKAEAGSDVTRLDYITNTSVLSEDNSFLNYSRDRSLGETLRCLSPRRTIRPLNDSYRQKAFRNNQNKSDLNIPYSGEDSVDRISGLKRKRSVTPEERKKFKAESSSGFVSYISSPLNSFRSRFTSEVSSSIPKLTGYKDSNKDLHEEVTGSEIVSAESEKRGRCVVM